jgi:hypothetical protein
MMRFARLGSMLVCALAIGACYTSRPCSPELCDGADNDCDGTIDEGFADTRTGVYASVDHCGSCDVSCPRAFPTAAATACVIEDAGPTCRVTACPDGERMAGDGACAPDVEVLCLPCATDADCTLWAPAARCLQNEIGGMRCGRPCENSTCPEGFVCHAQDRGTPQCVPSHGSCTCSGELASASFACLLHNASGQACAGMQRCTSSGLGECAAALQESCNETDDDCDDAVDEDFVDGQGRYVSEDNCGACGRVCRALSPNTKAECLADGARVHCEHTCAPGFVDVDGLEVTGCECELREGPGIVIGADGDCDGEVDPTPDLIFVALNGDDTNTGEDVEHPVRTIQRGLKRGEETGRSVLVARGIYQGPVVLVDGVSLLGGYSPDFRARDFGLFPVTIESPSTDPSAPVLRCNRSTHGMTVDGLTVLGGDATDASAGSTAVYLDRCSDALTLSNVTVLAGRAGAGNAGADSSANLAPWGLTKLAQLSGNDATGGANGNDSANACVEQSGGIGGVKMCPRGDVSGGAGGAANCPDLSTLCNNDGMTKCGNAGCTDFTNSSGVCDLDAAKAIAIANPSAASGSGMAPGAAGAPTYSTPTNRGLCDFCDDNPSLPRGGLDGEDGAKGDDGEAGDACDGIERIDLTRGLVSGGDGGDGTDGDDGSGGGGASAGAGFAVIGGTETGCGNVSGGSGGGGGSGGCGAPGARGGTGGGASIGVLVRLPSSTHAGPRLDGVRIVTGSGGDGGAGGIGAAGGAAGTGALGGNSQFWCARNGGRGGDGGKGGAGGGGGGGCGGGSYGVFMIGDPSDDYVTGLRQGTGIEHAGVPGMGGSGGFSPGAPGPTAPSGRSEEIARSN